MGRELLNHFRNNNFTSHLTADEVTKSRARMAAAAEQSRAMRFQKPTESGVGAESGGGFAPRVLNRTYNINLIYSFR